MMTFYFAAHSHRFLQLLAIMDITYAPTFLFYQTLTPVTHRSLEVYYNKESA